MNNLDLFPISTETIDGRIMRIGGVSLKSMADQYQTPLYLYDSKTVNDAYQSLESSLQAVYPGKFQIAYASKAYLSYKFAEKIAGLGCAIDVVSLNELKFALAAGFPPEKIHMHGNNKSREEIELAVACGIDAIVIDSLDELCFVEAISQALNKKPRIWLRINPDVSVKTHKSIQTGHKTSKFGIPIDGEKAENAIYQGLRSKHLKLIGLHTHLGSQIFQTEPYAAAITTLLDVCKSANWHPTVISPGGGWGVPYFEEAEQSNPDLWVGALAKSVQDWCAAENREIPKLVIEPGRWLIARAGVALYRVGAIKETKDNEIIASVDGGMADNPRQALYEARYTAAIIGDARDRLLKSVRLVGRYCESGDEIVHRITLPCPQRGDLIAIPVSGAYQISMASNYNLMGRPAVLWLEDGQVEVLQPRENVGESTWWRGE